MYSSSFPSSPITDQYLRAGRITAPGETGQDMVNRIVTALATVDARFDPAGAQAFAERLGRAMDTARIVFSTPIMTNAGRYADRPLAACAVPPVDLRGDLQHVKAVVDDYHRAGMGTGLNLDDLDDPVAVLRYLNEVAVTGANSGVEDRPVGNMAILSLAHHHASEFIACKLGADQRGEEWKFNISLHVTDAEIHAARTTAGRERELLVAAAEAAHTCADPGLLFADRMNEANPTPEVGADLLLAAGLPYDSLEGRQLAQEVLAFINYTSKLASMELAARRSPCPAVRSGRSRYADTAFLKRFAELNVRSVTAGDWAALAEEIAQTNLLRNSSTIAIPPIGRSAPVIGASTGIEPLFRLTDPHLPGHIHLTARSILEQAGRADLFGHVMTHGRLPDNTDLPTPLRAVLATATQIAPTGHLAMAAAVQACVDEAVSKTVNLPSSARPIDVYDTYLSAWELGCKGITVYVDGSRQVQPKALWRRAMTDRSEFVFDTRHDRYPVAVHVFLTDIHGRILLMRRAGSGFADGQLGLPAGHIGLGETPTECAVREVREELGITLDPAALRPAGTMFRRSQEPRLDIFFTTSTWVGQPEISEPHKCTELVWADPEDLTEDALDFLGQACSDARTGQVVREYGWAEMAASHPVHPTL